ncbi:hypothetical protein HA052_19560 [Chromobacterium haemolyticum]|uniref:Uncharacterized protein n=1 Tax=Chromobacterium fluminis TaxID=3044269 RepID=A0ABX0LDA4_9NEIS|nr:hypothetical protein [Chromobacterium haemolyticum]NHR07391.1 hypothetical protein [Chromobacterium haemolyticum]
MKKKRVHRPPSFDISIKMVAPGLDAVAAIRQGTVDQVQVVNLRMMSKIASAARLRKLLAPDPDGLEALISPLVAALDSGDMVQLDLDELEHAELWLTALRDMLGRASAQSLQALLDDLIVSADIRQQLKRIDQASELA